MRTYPLLYGPVSSVTDYTTPAIPVGDNGNITIGVTLTGADVVGSILVQGAMTQDFAKPFPLATASAVTASGDTLLQFPDIAVPYVRVFWDYTSGTGNISIDVSIKQQILNRG